MKDTRQEQPLKRREVDHHQELSKRQRYGGVVNDDMDQSSSQSPLPNVTEELVQRRIEAITSCRYSPGLSPTLQSTANQERLMALLWNVAAVEPK